MHVFSKGYTLWVFAWEIITYFSRGCWGQGISGAFSDFIFLTKPSLDKFTNEEKGSRQGKDHCNKMLEVQCRKAYLSTYHIPLQIKTFLVSHKSHAVILSLKSPYKKVVITRRNFVFINCNCIRALKTDKKFGFLRNPSLWGLLKWRWPWSVDLLG